jgi:hypothetical protein
MMGSAAYADAKKMGAVLGYGQFLTVLVNFIIVAGVLFVLIQAMNRLNKKEQPAPKPPKETFSRCLRLERRIRACVVGSGSANRLRSRMGKVLPQHADMFRPRRLWGCAQPREGDRGTRDAHS